MFFRETCKNKFKNCSLTTMFPLYFSKDNSDSETLNMLLVSTA